MGMADEHREGWSEGKRRSGREKRGHMDET
jgi:hypothetical protein